MRRHLVSICAITAMACAGAYPAFAADETGSTSSKANTATAQQNDTKNASDITCAEITQLDMMMVPGVLYFVAGHEHASEAAGTEATTTPPANFDAKSAEDKKTGDAKRSDKDAKSTSAAKSTNGDKSAQADQSAKADKSSSSDKSAKGSSSEMLGDTSGSSSSNGQADRNVVPVRGFYAIPVEEVMIACKDNPDRRASEVMKEHRGSKAKSESSNTQKGESSNSKSQEGSNTKTQ